MSSAALTLCSRVRDFSALRIDSSVSLGLVGISEAPTAHVLRRGSKRYALCCAIDILLNANGPPGYGSTRCPVCGTAIRIQTHEGAVVGLSPPGAVVNSQEMRTPDGRRGICCATSFIFDSEQCRQTWDRTHPDGRGVSATVGEYVIRCCAPGFREDAGSSFPYR